MKKRKARNRKIKSLLNELKKVSIKADKASDVMNKSATGLRNAADFIDVIQDRPKLPFPKFATGGIVHNSSIIHEFHQHKNPEPIIFKMPTDWDIDVNKLNVSNILHYTTKKDK